MRRVAQGLSSQLMDQARPALLSAHDLLPSAGRTLPRPAAGRSLAEVTRTKALSPTFKTTAPATSPGLRRGPSIRGVPSSTPTAATLTLGRGHLGPAPSRDGCRRLRSGRLPGAQLGGTMAGEWDSDLQPRSKGADGRDPHCTFYSRPGWAADGRGGSAEGPAPLWLA